MAEEVEVETEPGARSQRWKHEGQLDWMAENFGYDYSEMEPLDIVTVFALHRVPWRQSEEYAELCETHRQEMEEAKEERRAAAAERAAEKAAEKADAEAAAEKKAAGKGKATKASKAPAAKAAATSKRGSSRAASAARKPAGRAATKASRKSKGDDPFG